MTEWSGRQTTSPPPSSCPNVRCSWWQTSTPATLLMENLVNRARLVSDVSNAFDVSTEAAVIRLKDMGYIPSDDQTSYSAFTALMDFASVAI